MGDGSDRLIHAHRGCCAFLKFFFKFTLFIRSAVNNDDDRAVTRLSLTVRMPESESIEVSEEDWKTERGKKTVGRSMDGSDLRYNAAPTRARPEAYMRKPSESARSSFMAAARSPETLTFPSMNAAMAVFFPNMTSLFVVVVVVVGG